MDVWKTFKSPINSFILPQFDYIENDQALHKFNYDFCRTLLKLKGDCKLSKLQNKILSKILQGKLQIASDAFKDINNTRSKEFSNDCTNIIVTGNASIRFEDDCFGDDARVSFILPEEVNLYEIKETEKVQNPYTAYIFAPDFIEDLPFPNYEIKKINEINTHNLKATINTNWKFNRATNCIIETKTPIGTPIK